MSEINERALERLENLNHIEPLLASLRILSLSTLQMAQNRIVNLNAYKNEYERALAKFLTLLPEETTEKLLHPQKDGEITELVVLGSERGICGKYNKNLAAMVKEWVDGQPAEYQIFAFGARLRDALKQAGMSFQFHGSLSQGSKPYFEKASEFISARLQAFKEGTITALYVLSYKRISGSATKPVLSSLIPAEVHISKEEQSDWPPTLIEGDARSLAERTLEHLTVIHFYDLILESISAENTIRYNLLEEAKENVKEMVEALSIEIQIMKRQKVTQEIQEIAAGAGLTR